MKKLLVLACSLISMAAFAGQNLVKIDLAGSYLSGEQRRIVTELRDELEAIQKLDHSSKEYRERINGWIDWANYGRKDLLKKCGVDPEKLYRHLPKSELEHHKRLWKSRGMSGDSINSCIWAMGVSCPSDRAWNIYEREMSECGNDDGWCKAQAQLTLSIGTLGCVFSEGVPDTETKSETCSGK